MKIKDILIWLVIFIVGSLIVTFLINPQSFKDFKSNIGNSVFEVKTTSIPEVIKNNSDYSNKEITLRGIPIPTDAFCPLDACCSGLGSLDNLQDINSNSAIPIRYSGNLFMGDKWDCIGEVKKEVYDNTDCYYFDASSCKCIGDYCY